MLRTPRFNILNLLLLGLLACVLRSGINFVNGPVTQRNVSVSAAAQGYFPVGNAKQTAPYGERDPLPEGYGIRTGLSDLLKPLNAEAGVVAKEDSIPTILVMLTGIVLLFLFYLLLLLIDNQSVLCFSPLRMSSMSTWRTFCRTFSLARNDKPCKMKHSLNWSACFPIRSPCFHCWVTMPRLFFKIWASCNVECTNPIPHLFLFGCFHSLRMMFGMSLSTCRSSHSTSMLVHPHWKHVNVSAALFDSKIKTNSHNR